MIFKRGGKNYHYKFMYRGKLYSGSTRVSNKDDAKDIEAAERANLARGEVGIGKKKPAPLLKEFLKNDFVPFAESRHATKPATVRYYKQGADMLTKSSLSGLRLDELTGQHVQEFARKHASLSASGINRGLRTLRRSLNLAFQWGKMEKPLKVALAAGERQRDRVLSEDEITNYLNACPQPWKDCATIIVDEGFRPGEVFALLWPAIFLNEDGTGLIQVIDGKSKAARRMLPVTPRVHALLKARWESAGKPAAGWVFPSTAKLGHLDQNTSKDQHRRALEDSKVGAFPPYVLRHTALTRLAAAAGDDPFIVAKIAGHSSLGITMRYIHPQADAISRVFAQLGTNLDTREKSGKKRALRTSERKALKHA